MGIFDIFKKKKREEKKPEVEKKIPKVQPVKRVVPKKKVGEVYRILKEPHISEKATQLSDEKKYKKYTFKVYSQANKIQIKKAISNLYRVKVKHVDIINIKPKKRVLRGIEGTKTGYKKAVVTLEQGEKIELLPH